MVTILKHKSLWAESVRERGKKKAACGFKAKDLRMNTPRIQRRKQRKVEQKTVGRH